MRVRDGQGRLWNVWRKAGKRGISGEGSLAPRQLVHLAGTVTWPIYPHTPYCGLSTTIQAFNQHPNPSTTPNAPSCARNPHKDPKMTLKAGSKKGTRRFTSSPTRLSAISMSYLLLSRQARNKTCMGEAPGPRNSSKNRKTWIQTHRTRISSRPCWQLTAGIKSDSNWVLPVSSTPSPWKRLGLTIVCLFFVPINAMKCVR